MCVCRIGPKRCDNFTSSVFAKKRFQHIFSDEETLMSVKIIIYTGYNSMPIQGTLIYETIQSKSPGESN